MAGFIIAKINLIFAAASLNCPGYNNSFFGFPHWWKYLDIQKDALGKCAPVVHMPGGLWAIGLAIVDMLLRLAGIAAVLSIIFAGISYIGAAGSADKITSARKRIVNSMIGLAIVLAAAGIVSFIGNRLG